MEAYLAFTPIYQERVWGGRALAGVFGRVLPEGGPIGESWELVDREEANSQLAGPEEGRTIGDLRRTDPEGLLGPGWPAERPFPILVKLLDCAERLSLQVHPPEAVARRLGGEPKTENWYILEAQPGAALLAGLQPGVDRGQFLEALQREQLEPLVRRMPSSPGDSLFVRSGWIHAIDGGNLILEIQQNSDTTYRVYDWGRVGLDGRPRQLHIEESMESIDFSTDQPELLHPEGPESLLADCPAFRLRCLELPAGAELCFAAEQEPRVLSLASGQLEEAGGGALKRGDTVLLPYKASSSWTARAPSVLLVTDRFHSLT